MEKTSFKFLFYIFIFSFSFLETSAKTQKEALNQFYKEKYKSNSTIDESHVNLEDYYVVHDDQIQKNQEGMKEKDEILRLPGQHHKVPFKQYGGYVTVNKTSGRAFYYYFVEANEKVKKHLPLVLWLNGGPACSSLGYGAFAELGPFRINSDGKTLFKNTYAWNHVANILFVESPAGVGFSYSNNSDDYKTRGDKNTAADNLVFLLNWLERFPEYKHRPFYVSGESYAGHYVPQLTHNIIHHNKNTGSSEINLKGILIGNAVINDKTFGWGIFDFLHTHALISDEAIDKIHKTCDFNPATNISVECKAALSQAYENTKNIDMFNIYAPLCHDSNLTRMPKRASQVIDPCIDHWTYAYMNRADVQHALHANVTKLTHDWQLCSDVISAWVDRTPVILPLLRELLANGLQVWVFSGDVDGRVPVTSTRYSLNVMKLPVTTSWHPWYYDKEVGGYTEGYGTNLTFATVRGAGHQVPSYQGGRPLVLFSHFLSGKPLPFKY